MGSLAGPLLSAGVKFAGSKLLGGGSRKTPQATFIPSQGVRDINAGGLRTSFDPETGAVSSLRDPNRVNALTTLNAVNQDRRNALGSLRAEVTPGFGRLTESRVAGINNARRRAIGNLRENLARRRVLGSSFGEDALARTELEFGQAEGEAHAQSFLQELDANVNLTNQIFDTYRQAFQNIFSELNIEAGAATQLATLAQELTARNNAVSASLAASNAGLQAESQRGAGAFAGSIVGPLAKAAGRLFTTSDPVPSTGLSFPSGSLG